MSLQHVIEAARAAVTGRAGNAAHLVKVSGVVTHPEVVKVLKMNTRDANHVHCDKHPNNFKQSEELLAQGATLTKRGADYVTEASGVMSWRTVKALRERGVLEPV